MLSAREPRMTVEDGPCAEMRAVHAYRPSRSIEPSIMFDRRTASYGVYEFARLENQEAESRYIAPWFDVDTT